jgi:hypothetical protein
MEGFLPFTKSFWGDVRQCPWKAYQHKVCRIKSKTTKGAWTGLAVHRITASIRKGESSLDQFLSDPDFFIDLELDPEDRQEIIDMVQRAFTSDPIVLTESEQQRVKVECYFAVDDRGHSCGKGSGIVHGYLDRLLLRDDGSVVVDDLKTDRWPSDNPAERICYVLGAKATYPEAIKFLFGRHYLRTGNYIEWNYEFKDGKKSHKLVEIDPSGRKTVHGPFPSNPLLIYVKDFIDKIEKMEAVPTPGPHCESWYGEPCQFLGNECPAAAELPAVVDDNLPADPDGLSPSGLLKAIADSENLPITKDQAGWAYSGAIQLEGFVKRLKKKIEAWSKANGTLTVGETEYGWFTTPETEVDKACALSEMLRTMTVEEIANVVSISKTSINTKIGKRKYPQLREFLLSMAVSEVDSKPKFGAIKNVSGSDE